MFKVGPGGFHGWRLPGNIREKDEGGRMNGVKIRDMIFWVAVLWIAGFQVKILVSLHDIQSDVALIQFESREKSDAAAKGVCDLAEKLKLAEQRINHLEQAVKPHWQE